MLVNISQSVYSSFFVIPRCPNFICRRFGTHCSETSGNEIQTPGYHPKERIQHSKHGKGLKSGILMCLYLGTNWRNCEGTVKKFVL